MVSTVNLSAKQRDILETAANDGVYRESPPPYSDTLQDIERVQSRRRLQRIRPVQRNLLRGTCASNIRRLIPLGEHEYTAVEDRIR